MRTADGKRHLRAPIGTIAVVLCLLTASCDLLVRSSTPLGGGGATGDSSMASPNHDGRYVAFVSDSPDLVVGDTNGVADVFVRDHETGTTERVSVSGGAGGQANGASTAPSISSDGRYVAFASDADDLVADDTNGVADVFVRDRTEGTTVRVSVADDETQLATGGGRTTCRSGASDCAPVAAGVAIAGDGSAVAFIGREPAGERSAVLWRDLAAGTTETVAVAPTEGAIPIARFAELALSSDGSTLAVTEEHFAPPSPTATGLGLRIVSPGVGSTWVSPPSADPVCCHPDLSDDGRFVAFSSRRPLVAEDDAGTGDDDVFVFDRTTSAYERVSVGVDGQEIDGGASSPSISGDGSLVSWSSADPMLGIPAGPRQTFVRDRDGARTWVVSRSALGHGNADSVGRLSGDGRVVAIESAATNLDLSSDPDPTVDLFVHTASVPAAGGAAVVVAAGDTATPVTISGSGFRTDTIVESLDPDVRITSTSRTSSTRMSVTVTVHPGALPGPATLRITNRGPYGTHSTTTCDCLTVSVAPLAPASGDRPPDVVVVVTDDQRWDSVDELPRLDARADWARFDRSYVELPLCCPARASFLTGRSSLHTGVDTLRAGHLLDESTTLATMLDGAGYRTALIGKYLNDYPFGRGVYTPPGWDHFVAYTGGGYTGYSLKSNGSSTTYGSSIQDYSTDVLSAEARAFLRSAAPTEPVLLYLAYNAPHIDSDGRTPPAQRHVGACDNRPVVLPPSFGAHDTVSEPAWMAPLTQPSAPIMISRLREQCAALRSVDEGVASIIDEMDRLGRLDDTYVVFTSDNGYSRGEHRLGGKGHLYDESARVPLMVLGPGVVPGPTPRLTSNIDLTPTIVDWAGVTPAPGFFDGDSYADALRGAPGPEPTEVLLRGCRTAAGSADTSCGAYPTGMPNNWGLRTDRYKYIEYPDGDVQLFDLEADPWELTNLGPDPASAPLIAALHARLVQRRGF